jgi:hypothetical protein
MIQLHSRTLLVCCALLVIALYWFPARETKADPKSHANARDIVGPAAIAPVENQPAAKIFADPPLPDLLAKGKVVIQYRTENLRILPVFGPEAVAVSPRIGHLHVTVDDAPWHWADTSGQELILNGLPPGPHKVLIELATANHQVLAQNVVKFEVPERASVEPDAKADTQAAAKITTQGSAPKLIVEPPQPDRLARGVVFIQYRTEKLQIAPVFGQAALAVSPPLGHLHVTVDGASWHWGDASGGPLIVAGLPFGRHTILIELVNANHKTLAQELVKFEVP